MPRRADLASRLFPWLGSIGLVSLAVITLSSPGATRMHAWPWSIVYALALIAPSALFLVRLWDRALPLILPRAPWTFLAAGGAVLIIFSGMASPFRGPSLWWSTPLLAALALFFVTFDWIHRGVDTAERRRSLQRLLNGFYVMTALASMTWWAMDFPGRSFDQMMVARNPYPLGHSNYTAGLALLMLPGFALLAWTNRGFRRLGWTTATLLALAMLITSGSRGGMVGLAALVLGAVVAGWPRGEKSTLVVLVAAAAALVLGLMLAHPRTRAMFDRPDPGAALNASNVQRTAMMKIGLAMARTRPVLGWGPGSTPLAFPRFRAEAEGGVEDVLQLHSLPVQLLAELGVPGLLGFLGFIGLIAAGLCRRDIPVAVTLVGYLVFALTDYQLDVPVFAFAIAILAALLASGPAPGDKARARFALDLVARAVLVCLFGFARHNPTPGMNVRALEIGRDPANRTEAVDLLTNSLALNPDQEIAQFNLGWLLVVSDPPRAEQHFLAAARLVPDKGSVYFGLGLSRLNQGRNNEAAEAFALECINDPVFFVSPWWRDPSIAANRDAAVPRSLRLLAGFEHGERKGWVVSEAAYLSALFRWLSGTAPASDELVARATTPERRAYFRTRPKPPAFDSATLVAYRRQRSGYPVLMRDLDLAVPVDLFDVQENALASRDYRFLFPAKGWLGVSPLSLR